MASKEAMIKWMEDRKGKVTYSMTSRLGPSNYDYSCAVFNALITGGYLKNGTGIGNTETLFSMRGKLLKEISRTEVKRGDIFVSGTPGGSNGSAGHTGIFLSNSSFIHCSYYWNTIHVDYHDSYMGTRLEHHFYRIIESGETSPSVPSKPQQIIITVDGQFGPNTARRLQEYFDTAGKDGVISHQYKQEYNKHIYDAQFDNTLIGSNVVIALQKWLGVTQDGLFGRATIIPLQKRMRTTEDGYISPVSDCVEELQRRLNANKL